jgi:general secretion pathway protein J
VTGKSRGNSESGLTLIELLVVLALMALLGGLSAAALRSASSAWQRIILYDSDTEELLTVDRVTRNLLSQIVPQKLDSWSQGTIRFGGTAYQMQFLGSLPERFGAEDVVSYSIGFAGDGTLRLAWHLDRDTPSGRQSFAPDTREEVIANVSEGVFSYFGTTGDAVAHWQEDWKNQTRLPQLIRIRFAWHGRQEELVVVPLVTTGPCLRSDSDQPCLN